MSCYKNLKLKCLASVIAILMGMAPNLQGAGNSWVQTDWSSGVGASTDNQYQFSTLNTSTSGQFSLNSTTDWFSSEWDFRTPITLSNTGSEQTDYAVRVIIPFNAQMLPDFSDIRFANDQGDDLNYWIESKTNTVSATVWVKVDVLEAAGDTVIYLYYGNADAMDASNGENTFLFFDNFNGGTINASKWTQANALDDFNISSSELVLGQGNSAWNQAFYTTQAFNRSDLSFEINYRWTSANASNDALMMGWKDNGTGASYTNLVYGYYNSGGGTCTTNCVLNIYEDGTSKTGLTGTWTKDTQYLIRLRMKNTGGAFYEQSANGGATWTTSFNSSYSIESTLHPGFTLHSGLHAFDNARVRKWMSSEPTSSIGSEENYYASSGELISNIFDTDAHGSYWGTLGWTTSLPTGTNVKVRTAKNADMSDASNFADCPNLENGEDISASACVKDGDRYVQYTVLLSRMGQASLVFSDLILNYVSTEITAHAGSEILAVSGRRANLNGDSSVGQELKYLWAIFDGVGTLENATTATPTYVAPAGLSSQDVLIGLTIFDAYGKKASDTLTVHVIGAPSIGASSIDLSGVVQEFTLLENSYIDAQGQKRIELLAGNSTSFILPENTENYYFASGEKGGFALATPGYEQGAGGVFLFSKTISNLEGALDLNIVSENISSNASSKNLVGKPPLALSSYASPDNEYTFIHGLAQDSGLGEYLAVFDLGNDGADDYFLSAPGNGDYGSLYIYGPNKDLTGIMLGTASQPIGSLLTGDVLGSNSTDLFLGPRNLSLNSNLSNDMSAPETVNSILVYSGDTSFSGVTSPDVLEPDLTFSGSLPYQSLAVGDLNGDDQADVAIGSNDGTVRIYFGRFTSGNELNDADADVTILGTSFGKNFGHMLSIGDTNGDSYGDLVIGAPGEDPANDFGHIYFILGSNHWNTNIDVAQDPNVLTVSGTNLGDAIGYDLLLTDIDKNGTNEVYTLTSDGYIFFSDPTGALIASTTTQGPGTGGNDGPESGGAATSSGGSGGCSLSKSQPSNQFNISFVWLLIAGLIWRTQRKRILLN